MTLAVWPPIVTICAWFGAARPVPATVTDLEAGRRRGNLETGNDADIGIAQRRAGRHRNIHQQLIRGRYENTPDHNVTGAEAGDGSARSQAHAGHRDRHRRFRAGRQ